MVRLMVCNHKISEDLKKLGVVKNKTKVLRYNNCIPEKNMAAFCRGLLDGDGTIGINRSNGYPWVHLVSSSSFGFVEDLKNVLKFKMLINYPAKTHYVLRVGGGIEGMKEFLDWIYKDKGDLYLRRKFERYENMQSKIR